jgi:hypothetical protein
MGRVKDLLLNLINSVEENLSDKIKSLSVNAQQDCIIQKDKEPPSISEEDCLLFNAKNNEENVNILKLLDYKTYLLLSILPSVKLDEDEPKSALDIFTSEQLLMENWLEHLSNLDRIKKFQKLIRPSKTILSKSSSYESKNSNIKRNIKCLRDLPLQRQTLN